MKQDLEYRLSLFNSVISKYGYERYLEIGVATGLTFRGTAIKYKVSVDPKYPATFKVTSDRFFDINHLKFDIIFIDGLHEEEQVDRDISNSLDRLNENGTIFVHDSNPGSEWHQRPFSELKGNDAWCGTVWKAIAKLKQTRDDLIINVIDRDCGLGVIRRGSSALAPIYPIEYKYLDLHRVEMLGLVKELEI